MSELKPTKALASFAANLDPATLPVYVRQKLGWLLLDYLRVCSIGERLPWSDWARAYVGVVGKAGVSHVLFSQDQLNPQHATFMNVTFGSSFDADDTHVGAMLHPGVAVWSAALATAEHVGAPGPQLLAAVAAGYETIIRIGLPCSPGISSAASRAQARVMPSARRQPRVGSCFAERTPSGESKTPSGSPAVTPAGSRSSTIPDRRESESRRHTLRSAGWPPHS
jgi:hypothetical protein